MSWQRIQGHEQLVTSFKDLVQRGRLAHAYLFVGPSGVGKKLFATELAKALLCETAGGKLEACDQCASCLLVDAGTHPDIAYAAMPEEKHVLPIDVIREVSEKLSLKPARGGYKVAVIDDADDFNAESANCFLKTLEEPPPKTLLILLATDVERQLSTIVSRCQVVRFAPLPTKLIAELLAKQGFDASKAERLARISAGSLGLANDLADDELWKFRGELIADLSQPFVDVVALGRKWMAFVEEAGKESARQRRRAALILRLIIDLLSDSLAASTGARRSEQLQQSDAAQTLALHLGTDRLLKLVDRCLEAEMQIDRKVQLVLIIEALADSFAAMAA